jgi:citrate synthase
VTAATARVRAGREPIEPRPDLGLAANLLCMLHGRPASEARAAELDTVLTLHAEHGMNASTFAARVAASTRTDLHAAVAAAMGTLKGPLHGGASEGVMRMLREIGSPGRARAWVESALERGERVMGFGHHHYRTVDPRVRILEAMAGRLLDGESDGRWLEISREIRSAMSAEMLRRGKAVYPNVDFFTASVYFALGIPPELSACVFACARMPGWTAHIMEQRTGRLIRPDAVYVGPEPRSTGRQGARP